MIPDRAPPRWASAFMSAWLLWVLVLSFAGWLMWVNFAGAACTTGPDLAPETGRISISFSMPDLSIYEDMDYSGTGLVDLDYESYFSQEKVALDRLLFDLWGQLDQVHDVAFFLVTHGYNSTYDGLVTFSDGSRWQVVCDEEMIRTEDLL